jgi:hypothetical protein
MSQNGKLSPESALETVVCRPSVVWRGILIPAQRTLTVNEYPGYYDVINPESGRFMVEKPSTTKAVSIGTYAGRFYI